MTRATLMQRRPRQLSWPFELEDFFAAPFVRPSFEADGLVPRVDAVESDSEYRVTVELPGLEEKDYSVELEDGVLTIRGEKQNRFESQGDGENVRRQETRYGRFERRLRFDAPIVDASVTAFAKNGVLTLVVPKLVETRPPVRTIEVSSG